MYDPSKLFGRPGYLSLREYIDDIAATRKKGSWNLPLGIGDRIQFLFLKALVKFSWLSESLHIVHASDFSPSYGIIFSFIKKNGLASEVAEKILHCRGYFSYFLEKKISIGGHTRTLSGYGVAEDRLTALSKAFGEMLERTISGAYDLNKNIQVFSPLSLEKNISTFYPPKYHRFLSVQKEKYNELSSDPTNPIAWVEGTNLVTLGKAYIPRQITSWFIKNHHENPLLNATTNGAAGYFTKTGAVLRGLLEVVQRDGFLVHWLTKIAPTVIEKKTLPTKALEKIHHFESTGISLHVLDATALSIPTIIIAGINDQSDNPQVVLSSASATSFEQALYAALNEMAISCEMFYYHKKNNQTDDVYSEPFTSPLGQIDRQLFWRGAERIKQFEWFLSGEQVSYEELCKQDLTTEADDTAQLKTCLNVLKKIGSDYYPIVYFPEHPIQEELGFFIAQVYIPKAFPLYLLECQGTFDSDRLKEFAESRNVEKWELNPLPHMLQ